MPDKIRLVVTRGDGSKVTVVVQVVTEYGPDRALGPEREPATGPPVDAVVVFSKETLFAYLTAVGVGLNDGSEIRVQAMTSDAGKMLLLLGYTGAIPDPVAVDLRNA